MSTIRFQTNGDVVVARSHERVSLARRTILASIGLGVATAVVSVFTVAAPAQAVSPLCEAVGLDSSYEWLTNVTVSTVSIDPEFPTGDYYDASATTPPAAVPDLTAGQTYPVSVTIQANPWSVGEDWIEDGQVWIDFNGNNDLETSEVVLLDGSDTNIWDPVDPLDPMSDVTASFSSTFTVPMDAVGGVHFGRAMDFDNAAAPINPCVGAPDAPAGSAVDFEVNVIASPTLPETGALSGLLGAPSGAPLNGPWSELLGALLVGLGGAGIMWLSRRRARRHAQRHVP